MMIAENTEVKWDRFSEIQDHERERLVEVVQASLAPSGITECTDCAETIPPERLKAAPFATRCIHCQTNFERTAK